MRLNRVDFPAPFGPISPSISPACTLNVTPFSDFRQDIVLKLRKIKRLISINQKDLEKLHTAEEQLSLLQTHKHLKDLEVEMTRQIGTVILR